MVDLDLYRVFYTVAKVGSLTKAAEELYISQPAVSQAIKQLETQLGGKLFNRVSRGMELTDSGGKQIFEIVEKAVKMLDGAEDKFKELKNIATGSLTISAASTTVTHFLMPYIKKYHELYPNVNITFKDGTTKETLDAVKAGKSEVGFVNLPIYDKDVILTGQTGMMEDIFVASDRYKNLFDKVLDLRDIPNYPILMLENATNTTKEIINFLDSMNVKIVPEFEIGSVELLVEMAKNGMGIACIPRRYILDPLEKHELFEIKVTPSLPLRAIGVIVNKDSSSHTFAVKEFLRLLDDESVLSK